MHGDVVPPLVLTPLRAAEKPPLNVFWAGFAFAPGVDIVRFGSGGRNGKVSKKELGWDPSIAAKEHAWFLPQVGEWMPPMSLGNFACPVRAVLGLPATRPFPAIALRWSTILRSVHILELGPAPGSVYLCDPRFRVDAVGRENTSELMLEGRSRWGHVARHLESPPSALGLRRAGPLAANGASPC